ncbi:hypothetical protein SY212_04110 [Ligilactobacillus agilis]|uniref:Uncharacterized protein n=1 Tax=Ligilactobacillus agilis TaxID=1601 RepID=A0A6F9XJE0_9LACO|nr:hypothetical protein [Ligilactobacillus agilis]GET05381.1 hypothetical protein SY212_04110 [Ligilactobacillus agilis]
MENLTGQKVWLVKAKLGETWGVIGVFDNALAAEKFAEEKYREWTDDEKFTWGQGQTAQEVHIESSTQPLDGKLIISEYPVRSK